MKSSNRIAAALALGLAAHAAGAQELCPVSDPGESEWMLVPSELFDSIVITADHAELYRDGRATLEGDIEVSQGESRLRADLATFDPVSEHFELSGHVRLRRPGVELRGDSAIYNSRTGNARLAGAQFLIPDRGIRGSASTMRSGVEETIKLKDVRYTTCPEDKEDWVLKADKIELDRAAGRGAAQQAMIKFKRVPFLYLPYFTFPLDDRRKSGFLIPEIGNSDRSGFELRTPIYWNIAPNYDLTFSPRLMTKRGIQYNNEFRYLFGEPRTAGEIQFEYLPSDDERDGDDRHFASILHQTRFDNDWWANIDASDASDANYFEDLGSNAASTSQTHLERALEFERNSPNWSLLARFQNFQTIDDTIARDDEPYERLPQLIAQGRWPEQWFGTTLGLDSEFVHFDRDIGVTGQRLDIYPHAELPLERGGMYLRPAAGYRYTVYSLSDLDDGVDTDDTPDRAAPIYSVDAGMRLEREAGKKRVVLNTLEPRVQYVYIPRTGQDDIPIFDTLEPDFNLVQLFQVNRYAGPDRLGDTNRIALGLTTRVFDPETGRQFLSATVGQQYFFENETVSIPGETPNSSGSSDIIAELGFGLYNAWNVDLDLRWDQDKDEFEKAAVRFQYRPKSDRVANLSYRLIENQLEQIDFSTAWPLSKRWRAIGRYNYSIRDDSELERFVGLEYENCCWALRGVYRRLITDREGDRDTAFMLQLELKGLASVGSSVESLLQDGILGYQ